MAARSRSHHNQEKSNPQNDLKFYKQKILRVFSFLMKAIISDPRQTGRIISMNELVNVDIDSKIKELREGFTFVGNFEGVDYRFVVEISEHCYSEKDQGASIGDPIKIYSDGVWRFYDQKRMDLIEKTIFYIKKGFFSNLLYSVTDKKFKFVVDEKTRHCVYMAITVEGEIIRIYVNSSYEVNIGKFNWQKKTFTKMKWKTLLKRK